MKHVTLFMFSVILFACSKVKDKKIENKKSDLYIEISINNDKSNSNQIVGNIKYHFKINDTLKIVNDDKRLIYFIADIKPHKDDEITFKNDTVFEKQLSFSKIIVNDTINIPFTFKGKFNGGLRIFGGINDTFLLNSYKGDGEKVRVISYDHTFKKEVYLN